MSYAFRQIPGYDFYIMVDDDIDLLDDDASLFNDITRAVIAEGGTLDLLALLLEYRPLTTEGFDLLQTVAPDQTRYCYFPLVGLSARAASFLFAQRQLEYARGKGLEARPMCEIFVPTLLHAAGFVCRDLAELVPGAYSETGMMLQGGDPGCGRPMGFDRSELQSDRMIHPVYTHAEFLGRLREKLPAELPDGLARRRAVLDGPIGNPIPAELRDGAER